MRPSLAAEGASYRVALIGEALGEDEANQGAPFVGRAGSRLSRLIEYAGLERKNFDIYNTVWCRPPDNKLEGTAWESTAIPACKTNHWGSLLSRSKVLVPLGNVPTHALTGKKGILKLRGYVEGLDGRYVLPTVHPSFIQRGMSKWSAPLIHDLQKAVELARNGFAPQFLSYHLDPSPMQALEWARRYRERLLANPSTYLSFDIETPGKGDDEDDVDTDSDAPDRTWNIERIGFSYEPLNALSIPWSPEYYAVVRLLLDSEGAKVVWNAGYDVPRLRRVGFSIRGIIHDGMVAWHILHTDLPKSLNFVATFTCPWQPRWKHLSGAKPAYYNATDADVELRSMLVIEAELRKTGLWEVYQRDVLDLEPILVHMQNVGMPVDAEVRLDRARRLDTRLRSLLQELEILFPTATRQIAHVYKNTPKDTSGLASRPSVRSIPTCTGCGISKPGKVHFKRYVKKVNPCAGAGVEIREVATQEFYRYADFKPSREQLIRYHQHIGRALPRTWDKRERKFKISFGEKQMRELILKWKDDIIYPLILEYRGVDKIAGTYVGRPDE
jgi:uracil-DNA glycosylase